MLHARCETNNTSGYDNKSNPEALAVRGPKRILVPGVRGADTRRGQLVVVCGAQVSYGDADHGQAENDQADAEEAARFAIAVRAAHLGVIVLIVVVLHCVVKK